MALSTISYEDQSAAQSGVGQPSSIYKEQQEKWQLVEDLKAGTDAMRKKGRLYLGQESKESDLAYQNRLNRTFLFNVYNRVVTSIVGLAFIKNLVVSNVPEELKYLEWDADGTGQSMTQVAYELATQSIHYGLSHLLVDFPQVNSNQMSLADWREGGYKPYMSLINPTNLIGFRLEDAPGIPNLENARIVEHKLVGKDSNPWEEKWVHYVRVLYRNHVETYMLDSEDQQSGYKLIREDPNTLGYIPLLTAYANKEGYMQGSPALYDLAQINLCHYQSSSDQRNILHIARVPFIFAAGFSEGELDNAEIGGNRIIVTSNENATMKHVEHTGQAIEAGRKDILDLENQMAVLGADLLMGKGVSRQTATARRIDQTESMSVLQMALRSVEQCIENAYQIAGEWIGVDASEVSVVIGDDLSVVNEPNPTNALIALWETGLLTEDQVVEVGQRWGILSSYFKLDPSRPVKQQLEEIERDVQIEVEATASENTEEQPE